METEDTDYKWMIDKKEENKFVREVAGWKFQVARLNILEVFGWRMFIFEWFEQVD